MMRLTATIYDFGTHYYSLFLDLPTERNEVREELANMYDTLLLDKLWLVESIIANDTISKCLLLTKEKDNEKVRTKFANIKNSDKLPNTRIKIRNNPKDKNNHEIIMESKTTEDSRKKYQIVLIALVSREIDIILVK